MPVPPSPWPLICATTLRASSWPLSVSPRRGAAARPLAGAAVGCEGAPGGRAPPRPRPRPA
eukprot:4603799-Pyramimonas_sp.AAC.1